MRCGAALAVLLTWACARYCCYHLRACPTHTLRRPCALFPHPPPPSPPFPPLPPPPSPPCRTAYISSRGDLVRSSPRVAAHYVRTWLALDLVSCMPWDAIMRVGGRGRGCALPLGVGGAVGVCGGGEWGWGGGEGRRREAGEGTVGGWKRKERGGACPGGLWGSNVAAYIHVSHPLPVPSAPHSRPRLFPSRRRCPLLAPTPPVSWCCCASCGYSSCSGGCV